MKTGNFAEAYIFFRQDKAWRLFMRKSNQAIGKGIW